MSAIRIKIWPLAAAFGSIFMCICVGPAVAASTSNTRAANDGSEFSITESAQGNFGKLSVGVGYVGVGTYLNENNVRRDGLHANLEISIEGEPALFQQPSVHEGQTVTVDGCRIFVEKINPDYPRGTIVVRIWIP